MISSSYRFLEISRIETTVQYKDIQTLCEWGINLIFLSDLLPHQYMNEKGEEFIRPYISEY